jgi:hypothetical protein
MISSPVVRNVALSASESEDGMAPREEAVAWSDLKLDEGGTGGEERLNNRALDIYSMIHGHDRCVRVGCIVICAINPWVSMLRDQYTGIVIQSVLFKVIMAARQHAVLR